MINEMSRTAPMMPLRAVMTRTLPQLGSGVNLFDAPVEAAGNSKMKIDMSPVRNVDYYA